MGNQSTRSSNASENGSVAGSYRSFASEKNLVITANKPTPILRSSGEYTPKSQKSVGFVDLFQKNGTLDAHSLRKIQRAQLSGNADKLHKRKAPVAPDYTHNPFLHTYVVPNHTNGPVTPYVGKYSSAYANRKSRIGESIVHSSHESHVYPDGMARASVSGDNICDRVNNNQTDADDCNFTSLSHSNIAKTQSPIHLLPISILRNINERSKADNNEEMLNVDNVAVNKMELVDNISDVDDGENIVHNSEYEGKSLYMYSKTIPKSKLSSPDSRLDSETDNVDYHTSRDTLKAGLTEDLTLTKNSANEIGFDVVARAIVSPPFVEDNCEVNQKRDENGAPTYSESITSGYESGSSGSKHRNLFENQVIPSSSFVAKEDDIGSSSSQVNGSVGCSVNVGSSSARTASTDSTLKATSNNRCRTSAQWSSENSEIDATSVASTLENNPILWRYARSTVSLDEDLFSRSNLHFPETQEQKRRAPMPPAFSGCYVPVVMSGRPSLSTSPRNKLLKCFSTPPAGLPNKPQFSRSHANREIQRKPENGPQPRQRNDSGGSLRKVKRFAVGLFGSSENLTHHNGKPTDTTKRSSTSAPKALDLFEREVTHEQFKMLAYSPEPNKEVNHGTDDNKIVNLRPHPPTTHSTVAKHKAPIPPSKPKPSYFSAHNSLRLSRYKHNSRNMYADNFVLKEVNPVPYNRIWSVVPSHSLPNMELMAAKNTNSARTKL